MRDFRRGVSETNPYESCIELWTSLETLAEDEAKTRGLAIKSKCPKCKTESETGRWKSQVVIREKYAKSHVKEHGTVDLKAEADKAREVRGRLVHGGELKDRKLKESAEKTIKFLLPACAVAIAETTNSKVMVKHGLLMRLPFRQLKLQFETSEKIGLAGGQSMRATVTPLFLPETFAEAGVFTGEVGISDLIPPIDPLALPELEQG